MNENPESLDLSGPPSTFTEGISVVIPTGGRLSLRASVDSALAQVNARVEVIVVVDGLQDDIPAIQSSLPGRVHVYATGRKTNANVARNVGVANASFELVAFLDDDDVWRPDKLAAQMRATKRSRDGIGPWLCTTAIRLVGRYDDEIWPVREKLETEEMGDYLFRRDSIRRRPRGYQTSTWLGPRELFERHPFDESRRVHQDWDWLIWVTEREVVEFTHVAEPLSTYLYSSSNSITSSTRWVESLNWARNPLLPISRRARGDFILGNVLSAALHERRVSPLISVIRAGIVLGKPGWRSVVLVLPRVFRFVMARIAGTTRQLIRKFATPQVKAMIL